MIFHVVCNQSRVDQSQKNGSSDQSEQRRLSERRGLERPNSLSKRFRCCEKTGDAAMYIMRKLTLDTCKPIVGDSKTILGTFIIA